MQELETKIATWRKGMSAALPGRDETVKELEEHLRDHIEAKVKGGTSPADAFAHAVARMGETQEVARAFRQLESRWTAATWSIAVICGLMAVPLVWMAGAILLEIESRDFLLNLHGFILITGYLAVFATGLLGLSTILGLAWKNPLDARDQNALQRAFVRFAFVGSGFVSAGIVLGMWWAAVHRGSVWSWDSIGGSSLWVCLSVWLLLAVQLRVVIGDRLRGLLAVLGCVVLPFGWVCGGAPTAGVPITWLCGSFIAGHVAIARLRVKDPNLETCVAAEI